MPHAFRLLVLTFAPIFSFPAFASSCTWFGTNVAIHQVDNSKNQVAVTVSLGDTQQLAMNGSHCGVWAIADRYLYRFDAAGVPVSRVALSAISNKLNAVTKLIVDPLDDSVWLSDDRAIFHVSAGNALISSWATPNKVRGFVLSLDRNVWVLGNKQVWQFGSQGNLVETRNLHELVGPEPKFLVLDDLRKILWTTGAKKLVQIPVGPALGSLRTIDLNEEAGAVSANPLNGELWLATKKGIHSYKINGNLGVSVELAGTSKKFQHIAFDPVTQSIWTNAGDSLVRFAVDGQVIASLPAPGGVTAIATPAFMLNPTVSLIQPAHDSSSNNPLPAIRYSVDALCNGIPCGFSPEYFDNYELKAVLNGSQISPFVIDKASGARTYQSTVRLPEGQNTLSAQVRDGFGRTSSVAKNTFFVDTVAPKISGLAAIEGSVSPTPNITLKGVVDDVTAVLVIDGVGQVTNTTIVGNTLAFSFPVVLKLGVNTFKVTAIDRATNTSTETIQVTYQPQQNLISIKILSPLQGATVSDTTVLVRGTYEGPPNTGLTINGVPALQDESNFYAQVPLQLGGNVLSIKASTISGPSVTETITVISEGVSAVQVSASPQRGVAPLQVAFSVQSNTDDPITKTEVDFDGDGAVDFSTSDQSLPITFTYTLPGTYQARFQLTDEKGTALQKAVSIVVEDPAQVDSMLRALWSEMLTALTRGEKEKAIAFFTSTNRQKYADIFEKLLPQMTNIFQSASPLEKVSLSPSVAEYAVNRVIGGENKIFFVYFLREDDGVWRIDSL